MTRSILWLAGEIMLITHDWLVPIELHSTSPHTMCWGEFTSWVHVTENYKSRDSFEVEWAQRNTRKWADYFDYCRTSVRSLWRGCPSHTVWWWLTLTSLSLGEIHGHTVGALPHVTDCCNTEGVKCVLVDDAILQHKLTKFVLIDAPKDN